MCISVELELGGIVSYVTRFDKQKKRIQEACKRGKKGDGRYVYIRLACCVCLCVCASLFAVCIYIYVDVERILDNIDIVRFRGRVRYHCRHRRQAAPLARKYPKGRRMVVCTGYRRPCSTGKGAHRSEGKKTMRIVKRSVRLICDKKGLRGYLLDVEEASFRRVHKWQAFE